MKYINTLRIIKVMFNATVWYVYDWWLTKHITPTQSRVLTTLFIFEKRIDSYVLWMCTCSQYMRLCHAKHQTNKRIFSPTPLQFFEFGIVWMQWHAATFICMKQKESDDGKNVGGILMSQHTAHQSVSVFFYMSL